MSLYNKRVTGQKLFCNELMSVTNWANDATGCLKLAKAKTGAVAVIKLNSLIPHSRLLKVIVHYSVGAGAETATKVTLSLRKVVGVAGGVTDTEIDGIAEATYVTDTAVEAEISVDEEIKEGVSYYVKVTATTFNDDASDAYIVGAECVFI